MEKSLCDVIGLLVDDVTRAVWKLCGEVRTKYFGLGTWDINVRPIWHVLRYPRSQNGFWQSIIMRALPLSEKSANLFDPIDRAFSTLILET